jgi:hypothetical protein
VAATFLEVVTPQCVAEDFDGEIVVLNTESGVYFSIRATGATVWRNLAAGHSVETVLTGAQSPEAAQAIRAFVDAVIGEGLMRPAATAAVPDELPRLEMSEIDRGGPPILEAFHDMKSLLLLDPVHEVDSEAGWPKLPKA